MPPLDDFQSAEEEEEEELKGEVKVEHVKWDSDEAELRIISCDILATTYDWDAVKVEERNNERVKRQRYEQQFTLP